MIAGCYDFHAYCDAPGCTAGDFGFANDLELQAETGGECRRRARRLGWRLDLRTGECVCPVCVKKEIRALVAKLGSMEKAATALGTSRSQLYRRIARAGGPEA